MEPSASTSSETARAVERQMAGSLGFMFTTDSMVVMYNLAGGGEE
jgi:hypothetical protein